MKPNQTPEEELTQTKMNNWPNRDRVKASLANFIFLFKILIFVPEIFKDKII